MPLIFELVPTYLFKLSNEYSLFLFSENGTEGGGSRVKYAVMDVPITLPSTKPATDKPNPKQGIGELLLCFATSADACCEVLFMHMGYQLSITDTRYADTGTGTAIRRYGDFQKIRIRRYGKYIYF